MRLVSQIARRRKARGELAFWRGRRELEGELTAGHYEHFFTGFAGLSREFYDGKRLLDVGCGPRGSLEWASGAADRVGLDPLAGRYRELGTDRHVMSYVQAPAEAMPFDDASFDVVSSLNSLDHVDDIERAAAEMIRVLAPGGTLLLVTEVGHPVRTTEPQDFGFDVLERFTPPLKVLDERRMEILEEAGILGSCLAARPYDEGDTRERPGLLAARLRKPPGP